MTRLFFSSMFIFSLLAVFSQSGGNNTYDFLNLTHSSRLASLGGQQISLFDDDLNLASQNPSLLNPSMSDQLVINYVNYLYDLNYGYVSYAKYKEGLGTFAAALQYFDYGDFDYADIYGNKNGDEFSAREYCGNIYYARPILDSLLFVGGNFKTILSQFESYNSFGVAIDAGITYNKPEKLFSAAFVLKNLGSQLLEYSGESGYEKLPFELQLGITQKLRYAPFRVSLLYTHLETYNLLYVKEEDKDKTDLLTGEIIEENKFDKFRDNLLRHFILGIEFLPSKNFYVNMGYNYKRRQELKIPDKAGFVGFSWGFGLKLKKFRFGFGRATYHLSGPSTHFSLTLHLSEMGKHFQ